jgi:lysophospholipase L1-like esterase
MAQPSKKSAWGKIKYWAIMLIVLAFLFEMFSSMVLFRKYSTAPLAIMQLLKKYTDNSPSLSLYHKMHILTRPDSSAEMCKRVADEIWEANKYSYEPWLMFRVSDYKSTYVNVKGFERKCIPSESINSSSDDTVDIFFFGGSTMYGWNLTDAETIPSQLLDVYKKKYPNGKSVRIRNYGIPYYYSKQELMLFSKLVFEGERPDIVIFMDGLNDFYPSRMLYYDRPHFSYAMQQVFDEKMFEKNRRTVIDTSEIFYNDVPGVPSAEYYQRLHDKYLGHLQYANALAEKVGAKSYFFCQPVPFFNYQNRKKDPISFKNDFDRYNYIYPLLREEADRIKNFVYLGDMLQNEKNMPFIDQVHYSPSFARKIAENILGKIENDLKN